MAGNKQGKKRKRSNSVSAGYCPPSSFYKTTPLATTEPRPRRGLRSILQQQDTPVASTSTAVASAVNDIDLESLSDVEIPTSSAPASPQFAADRSPSPIAMADLQLDSSTLAALGHASAALENINTPLHSPSNAFTPLPTTPTQSPRRKQPQTPMSRMDNSPIGLLGRPSKRFKRAHRNPLGDDVAPFPEGALDYGQRLRSIQEMHTTASTLTERLDSVDLDKKLHDKVWKWAHRCTEPEEQGGLGMKSMKDFLFALFSDGTHRQENANLTRLCRDHGVTIMEKICEQSPHALDEFLDSPTFTEKLRKEGAAIQKHLSRPNHVSMAEHLASFSMQGLEQDLKACAPTLWHMLTTVTSRQGKSSREKELVFVSICAMLSVVRSQKANNFQVVMGLFLLGSGASKREIAVLSEAGLCVSPTAINTHIRKLSAENLELAQRVAKEFLCSVAWDNLNFAFKVDAQRLDSKDHFDSGTTATIIVQHDPETGAPAKPGVMPLDLKPPRSSTNQVIDDHSSLLLPSFDDTQKLEMCNLWLISQIAIQHKPELAHLKKSLPPCPAVEPIALHTTQQHPVPAMHEDESSIDGTIKVYETIFGKLGVGEEDIKKTGLFFTDGDLLTDSLVDKVESGRRNSAETEVLDSLRPTIRRFGLFHAKMAGSRLVINEHWGKPNSPWPGSLWWEHTNLLGRKNITAGWGQKKAPNWKPTHEFLHISAAAHVLDAFRLHCGDDDFNKWCSTATMEAVKEVSKKVHVNLFSSAAYEKQRDASSPDTVLMNNILYNRDALYYLLLVKSIKAGDIGRVVLVLRVWMVMMRTPKTMPRYANALFETLGRLQMYPERVRKLFLHNWLVNLTGREDAWKEVDLLQEHTNFWLKTVYSAKGVNRNWEWLSMISVCIYTIRQAMRTVQSTFQIPVYGTRHTTPDMSKEVHLIAEKLREERIQQYVPSRPANEHVEPVRDLLAEGAKQANKRAAFSQFRTNDMIVENIGYQGDPAAAGKADGGEDVDMDQEDEYEPDAEDLAMDEDEPIEFANGIVAGALDLFGE